MRAPLSGLSPRRRALVASVLAVLVLAGVAVAVRLIAADSTVPSTVPPQDRPGDILLVPGYGGGTGSVEALAGILRRTGRTATVVRLAGDGTGDLREQAEVLQRQVRRALRAGAPSVDVIGYSAGGVVVRLWVQEHNGAVQARRIVTLGSPHHGADLATAGSALAPGACPLACQQLSAGSRLLSDLAEPVPGPPAWLSIWTTQDQTVTPPDSSRLGGAINLPIQSVCPDRRVSHGALPTDAFAVAAVLGAIGPGPITPPGAAACLGAPRQ